MFNALKQKYGSIGQDIIPDYTPGANLPKPVSFVPEPVQEPMQSVNPTPLTPTPLGEPTAVPRFSGLAKSMEAKYQNTNLTQGEPESVFKAPNRSDLPEWMTKPIGNYIDEWQPDTKGGALLKSLIAGASESGVGSLLSPVDEKATQENNNKENYIHEQVMKEFPNATPLDNFAILKRKNELEQQYGVNKKDQGILPATTTVTKPLKYTQPNNLTTTVPMQIGSDIVDININDISKSVGAIGGMLGDLFIMKKGFAGAENMVQSLAGKTTDTVLKALGGKDILTQGSKFIDGLARTITNALTTATEFSAQAGFASKIHDKSGLETATAMEEGFKSGFKLGTAGVLARSVAPAIGVGGFAEKGLGAGLMVGYGFASTLAEGGTVQQAIETAITFGLMEGAGMMGRNKVLKEHGLDDTQIQELSNKYDSISTIVKNFASQQRLGNSVVYSQEFLDMNEVPKKKPETEEEYKQFISDRLEGNIKTQQEIDQGNTVEAKDQTKYAESEELYRDTGKRILQISRELDIAPEGSNSKTIEKIMGELQYKLQNSKDMIEQNKIKKNIVKAKELFDLKRRFGDEIENYKDTTKQQITVEDAIKKLDTEYVGREIDIDTKEEKSKKQLHQILDFIEDNKPITDPRAKEKLQKVLESKTDIKDNGINYTQEVNDFIKHDIKNKDKKINQVTSNEDLDALFGPGTKAPAPTTQQPTPEKQPENPVPMAKTEAPSDVQRGKLIEGALEEVVSKYTSIMDQGMRRGEKAGFNRVYGKKKQLQQAKLKQPTVKDLQRLITKYGSEILGEALKEAQQKQAITREDYAKIDIQIQRALKNSNSKLVNGTRKNALGEIKTKPLTDEQKIAIMHWNGFKDILKQPKDFKINYGQVDQALVKTDSQLHIIDPGSHGRLPIPFSLVGNKASTLQNILSPVVVQGLDQGKNVYVEPYGGAGTSILMLPKYFAKQPDLQVHLNIFDPEKYTLTQWARGKTDRQIYSLVGEKYREIMGDITSNLMENPKFRETMQDTIRVYNETLDAFGDPTKKLDINKLDKLIGTKEMSDIAELVGFYPTLAKQFFKERLDGKVAIKGELTETFKDWLDQKYTDEGTKQGLQGEALQEYVDTKKEIVLNDDSSVFEKLYPGMSKAISTTIDKYDIVSDKMTPEQAMSTAIARQLRQRGASGQKVVSAAGGFQSTEGVFNKITNGLRSYRDVLDKYGDRIDIQNKDGGQFASDIAEQYKGQIGERIISYYDPPYTQSAQVYKANAKDQSTKDILDNFADPKKLADMFSPLKDATTIMTNDVNGPYIEAMKGLYGDRMGTDILAYKEGTTPTSLITTNNLDILPEKLGLGYYSIRKNPKLSQKDEIVPQLAQGLKKPLVKMLQEYSIKDREEALKLVEIKEKMEAGSLGKKQIEDMIGSTMSDAEKRKLINETFRGMKKGKITGQDAVDMFKKIERHMAERDNVIDDFKTLRKIADNKKSIDLQAKEYIGGFLDGLTTKKPSTLAQEVAVRMAGGDLEAHELYRSDKNIRKEIDNLEKTNINELDNTAIQEINDHLRYALDKGIEKYKQKQEKIEQDRNNLIEKTKETIKKVGISEAEYMKATERRLKAGEYTSNRDKFRKDSYEKASKLQKTIDGATPKVWAMDEIGFGKLKQSHVDSPLTMFRDKKEMLHTQYATARDKIERKYGSEKTILGIKKFVPKRFLTDDMERMGEYMLSMKDRSKGIPPLMAHLNERYGLEGEELINEVKKIQAGHYLEQRHFDLIEEARKIYGVVGIDIKNTYEREMNLPFKLEDNYYNVKSNNQIIENKTKQMRDDNESSLLDTNPSDYANGIKKGFTKEAKGGSLVPIVNMEVALMQHINDGLYYAHMETPLRELGKITNALETDLGARGFRIASKYVDSLKAQGNIRSNLQGWERKVEALISSTRKGILMAKRTLPLYQLTDVARASFAMQQNVVSPFIDVVWNKKVRDEIRKQSGHIRHRELDDPSYSAETGLTMWKNQLGRLVDKYGFYETKMLDRLASSAIFWTQYKKELASKGMTPRDATPEAKKEAGLNADTMVMKIASDPSFAGVADIILESRGFGKLITAFQNFTSNETALLRVTGKIEGVKSSKFIMSVVGTLIGIAMTTAINEEWRKIKGKDPYFQFALRGDPYREGILQKVGGQVPFVGGIMDMAMGYNIVSQYITKIVNGKGFTDPEKFINNALVPLMTLAGLPAQLLADINDLSNKPSTSSSSSSSSTRSSSRGSRGSRGSRSRR